MTTRRPVLRKHDPMVLEGIFSQEELLNHMRTLDQHVHRIKQVLKDWKEWNPNAAHVMLVADEVLGYTQDYIPPPTR